ncbi:MAG: ABC transporter substrate-binding protein [Rubrivivax sp.]|nr:ABC transporter substrate-binding protein [Rubrivivax sp.]
MKRRHLASLLGAATLAAALAAPATVALAQGSDAARLVPPEVRARGVLRVGSQQTFPPVEFREPGKSEVVGVSADLLAEVAKRLNLNLEYIQGEYASLISGVEADRFDIASGGISDTEEREQKLDFVNYMYSGGAMMMLSENPASASAKTIDDFCGKTTATLLGSRVIMSAVEAASERCTKAGKAAIKTEQLPSAPDARMQLDLKRVDAYMGDYPALVYMGSQFPGRYRIVGGAYILTPYITSWGFGKNRIGLRDAVHAAMKQMKTDGTYQKLMDKWGVGGGALPEISLNLPANKRPPRT